MKALFSSLAILAVFFPLGTHAETCPASADLAMIESARQATVTIRVPGPDGEEEPIGAGFVHEGTGKIVTNVHIVGDRDTVRIGLADGGIVDGRIVGRDNVADIALIEADTGDIAGLEFSDRPVHVGETVYAVGTPFGLGQTVTRGIVSALDRAIDATTPFGMIQHDAPLNPGSSGGPVAGVDGKVIGINVAMPDGFRRDVGIAYAIPASIAKTVVARLASGAPSIERRLGITVRALSPRLAGAIGAEPGAGALVEAVIAGSPADQAGLEASDILFAVGNHDIHEPRDVAIGVDRAAPDLALPLVVLRGEEKLTINLPPVDISTAGKAVESPVPHDSRGPVPASELGFIFAGDGSATVKVIERATAAAAAGMATDDVILAVGRIKVKNAEQAKRLIGQFVTTPFALLLSDPRGNTRYVVVDPWARGLDGDGLGGNLRHPRSVSF